MAVILKCFVLNFGLSLFFFDGPDADRKSLYTLFLESVQSRLQHGKDLAPDSITEQQVNKQSLIKMQSIVAKHLELNDVHDPLLAINFAR